MVSPQYVYNFIADLCLTQMTFPLRKLGGIWNWNKIITFDFTFMWKSYRFHAYNMALNWWFVTVKILKVHGTIVKLDTNTLAIPLEILCFRLVKWHILCYYTGFLIFISVFWLTQMTRGKWRKRECFIVRRVCTGVVLTGRRLRRGLMRRVV